MPVDGAPHRKILDLIDVLAIAAWQDARKAGRDSDANILLPIVGASHPESEYAQVYDMLDMAPAIHSQTGSKVFNDIMAASTKRKGRVLKNAKGQELTQAGKDSFLLVDAGESLEIDPMTKKIMLLFMSLADDDGVVRTDVDTLLVEYFKRPLTRTYRENVKKTIRGVAALKFFRSNGGGKNDVGEIPIQKGFDIQRGGKVTFVLNELFCAVAMRNAAFHDTDPVLCRTDDYTYPHAFEIGVRLNAHRHMNAGQANERRISVKCLLDSVKSFMTAEEVERNFRGQQTARIIAPMEKSLNHLVDIGYLEYWDYCHKNGAPLTDSEYQRGLDADGEEKPLPYGVAKDCLIEWKPARDFSGGLQAISDSRAARKREGEARKREKEAAEKRKQKRIAKKTEDAIAEKRAESAVPAQGEK